MAVWPAIPTTRRAGGLKPRPAPWQRHTARWGVSPTLIEDGKWGAKSSAAIRQFQKAYRIANLALWPLRPCPTTCSAASDGGSPRRFKTIALVQKSEKWTAYPSSGQGAPWYHYIRIDTRNVTFRYRHGGWFFHVFLGFLSPSPAMIYRIFLPWSGSCAWFLRFCRFTSHKPPQPELPYGYVPRGFRRSRTTPQRTADTGARRHKPPTLAFGALLWYSEYTFKRVAGVPVCAV